MIKFFRHIRRALIEQNRMGKYFKYAIGEIILVVIGILIALQINTWNSSRIDRAKEKEYLYNLLDDINIQKSIVDAQILHENKMRLKCEKALVNLTSKSISVDSINIYLTDITRKSFVINNPTFQDLKSSGNILLIKDTKLRNKILSFYQYLDYSALVVQTNNLKSISEFRDYLLKNNVVDMNYKDNFKVAGDVDWSLKSVDIPWAKEVIATKLEDKYFLFELLNTVSQRGRATSVNLDLMERMERRIATIQTELNNYLNYD